MEPHGLICLRDENSISEIDLILATAQLKKKNNKLKKKPYNVNPSYSFGSVTFFVETPFLLILSHQMICQSLAEVHSHLTDD